MVHGIKGHRKIKEDKEKHCLESINHRTSFWMFQLNVLLCMQTASFDEVILSLCVSSSLPATRAIVFKMNGRVFSTSGSRKTFLSKGKLMDYLCVGLGSDTVEKTKLLQNHFVDH